MPSVRFLVSGRVQGVFFRASAARVARELGLTGYARNLGDGRVEVIASGNPVQLDALRAWLHQGPPAAHVDSVEHSEMPAQDHSGFATL